jgi:L-lactate dehydrogenase complex protein LldF
MGLKIHAWLARHPSLYQALTAIVIPVLHLLGRKHGSFSRLPLAGGWTSQRNFPAPQQKTFMQLYKAQMKGRTGQQNEH